jgi:two-component system, chemotaxis family, chemotaxis protein CheY
MEPLNLICVDDQPDVLDAVIRDLKALEPFVRVEEAQSAAECLAVLNELDSQGERIALIVSDQVMPGQSGVELLASVSQQQRFRHTRKMLLTGQATHGDTINAINGARIDHYLEKPWQAEQLVAVARRLVSEYVFDAGIDYQPLLGFLDQQVVLQRLQAGASGE